MDTIDFIHQHEVPSDRSVAHATFVCDYRPLKEEPNRIRITVGGDCLPHDDDSGSPASDLLETKLILNSTISDAAKGTRFISIDIKDHFLATPMENPEYLRVKYQHVPHDIRSQHNLDEKVTLNEHMHARINKGMQGLN